MRTKMKELMSESKFRDKLNPLELLVKDSFVIIVQTFRWSQRSENDADLTSK